MNCPSRVEVFDDDGWNQNPPSLSADTTTRADLNGISNARDRRDEKITDPDDRRDLVVSNNHDAENISSLEEDGRGTSTNVVEKWFIDACVTQFLSTLNAARDSPKSFAGAAQKVSQVLRTFGRFIGPGQILQDGCFSKDIKLTCPINA
jgi:metal iron transporter